MSDGVRQESHKGAMIAAVASVLVALIAGLFTWLGQASGSPPSAPSPPGAGSAPPAAAQSPAAVPDSPAPVGEDHDLLFDGEVTLSRQDAVDLDTATASVVEAQVGATGNFDLFHDSGNVRSDNLRSHGSMFGYPPGSPTGPAETFGICSDYTGPSPSSNTATPSAGLLVGIPFCFVTSSKHLAWGNIEGVQDSTKTAVVRVRVWRTTVQN